MDTEYSPTDISMLNIKHSKNVLEHPSTYNLKLCPRYFHLQYCKDLTKFRTRWIFCLSYVVNPEAGSWDKVDITSYCLLCGEVAYINKYCLNTMRALSISKIFIFFFICNFLAQIFPVSNYFFF